MKKEISEKNIEKKFEKGYKNISIKDLNKKINDAIEVENYELAAKLRDEINQRK
jgi:protein-arginine kinase activator protein McsA